MSGGRIPTRHAKDQPRCEIAHTLEGGYCGVRGDVRLSGLLLCERHARQLEAQGQVDLLRGIVSSLELCLSNITLRRDRNLVRLLRAEKANAAVELKLAYEEVRRAAV